MTDEIIEDVWRAKEAVAKACHYDIDELVAEMRRREKTSPRRIVDLSGGTVSPDALMDETGGAHPTA